MIGSDTLIVRKGARYEVHVCSLFMINASPADRVDAIKLAASTWDSPAAVVDKDAVDRIFSAKQCYNKAEPGYSEFIGDRMFLWDADTQKLFDKNQKEIEPTAAVPFRPMKTLAQQEAAKFPRTLKEVTKYLREQSGDPEIELARGKGYFYFRGGKADSMHDQSVMTNQLRRTTLGGWLREMQSKLEP